MKKTILILSSLLLSAALLAQNSTGQTAAQPAAAGQAQSATPFVAGTLISAELSKSLDAKKAKVGDPLEARTDRNLLSNGQIVLPKNTKVTGHLVSVKSHSKDSPDSTVGIAFERLVMADGREVPLQLTVQAIGPGSSMNMGGATAHAPLSGVSGTTGAPQGAGMAVGRASGMPTASDNGAAGSSGALSGSSQGVVGLKDLSLSATPQASVISCGNKNVHLETGTQFMLRVQ